MVERKVPVIDIRDFPGQSQKLREACEAWGCFRIVNHKIPLKLMSEMKGMVRSLLDLPSEIKRRNTDVITGSGYMAPSEINPLYEALGLYNLGSPQAVDAFCCLLDASLHQRENGELCASITKTCHGGEPFKEWTCQLRINKYNITPGTLGSSGVQVHTDQGLFTILQDDDNVSGLDVMNSSGLFVALNPWPSTFLLNLGDLATIWSNRRWRNVKHCVLCKEATTWVSIPTFLLGPKQGVIEAAPELVDPKHLCLYGPVVYENFRNLRISKNLRAGEALMVVRAQF